MPSVAVQIEVEGWTAQHDDKHVMGQMAQAAGWYALNSPYVGQPGCIGDPSKEGHELRREVFINKDSAFKWPWDLKWWKPKDRRSDLVRAAALLLAEIERLDRAPALEAAATFAENVLEAGLGESAVDAPPTDEEGVTCQ